MTARRIALAAAAPVLAVAALHVAGWVAPRVSWRRADEDARRSFEPVEARLSAAPSAQRLGGAR